MSVLDAPLDDLYHQGDSGTPTPSSHPPRAVHMVADIAQRMAHHAWRRTVGHRLQRRPPFLKALLQLSPVALEHRLQRLNMPLAIAQGCTVRPVRSVLLLQRLLQTCRLRLVVRVTWVVHVQSDVHVLQVLLQLLQTLWAGNACAWGCMRRE